MKNKKIWGMVGIFAGGLIIGILIHCAFANHGMHRGMPRYGDKGGAKGVHSMHMNGEVQSGRSMQEQMDMMSMGLLGLTGDDFDKAFLSEMIVHHDGAIKMAELASKNSKRPELIKFANDIISAQSKEIETMESWRTTWFK